ncbi:zinc finger CCCH domain-containing protein 3 isoform X2 [Manihot esculenta]|nr:zinc finger CCCH domain-containing protein 3 isoform X2 [Manihot esculenta]
MAPSSPYPDRPGEPDCIYYLRTGLCGYGSNCRFNHPPAALGTQFIEELPERVGQPDCGYYLKTGTCKYGSTCKYHHPRDRNGAGPVSFNILGLPMRQDEKSCPYYMRTGSCKFGVACKFHHPHPAPLGTGLPLTGPAVSGPMGTSIMPSSGLPYLGGLPAWSLPRTPYVSGPRPQGPQAYMPVVLSPSQGVIPAQGWNTYVGNLNPMSSASVLGSSLVYNSRNQGESGSSGQVLLLSTTTSNLPERPDQPECRYYMNTGTCKYGSDCKYHHPKERIAQLATSSVGSPGLPSRPAQPVCSNYSMYGLCKFGPTCRFDHPFPGYPYSYSLNLQPVSIFDSSLFTYPRMSPPALSSESPVSLSPKFPDWVRNPDTASNKHQNSDKNTKISDDHPEQAGSPPLRSSHSSSEPSHD